MPTARSSTEVGSGPEGMGRTGEQFEYATAIDWTRERWAGKQNAKADNSTAVAIQGSCDFIIGPSK